MTRAYVCPYCSYEHTRRLSDVVDHGTVAGSWGGSIDVRSGSHPTFEWWELGDYRSGHLRGSVMGDVRMSNDLARRYAYPAKPNFSSPAASMAAWGIGGVLFFGVGGIAALAAGSALGIISIGMAALSLLLVIGAPGTAQDAKKKYQLEVAGWEQGRRVWSAGCYCPRCGQVFLALPT